MDKKRAKVLKRREKIRKEAKEEKIQEKLRHQTRERQEPYRNPEKQILQKNLEELRRMLD